MKPKKLNVKYSFPPAIRIPVRVAVAEVPALVPMLVVASLTRCGLAGRKTAPNYSSRQPQRVALFKECP